MLSDKQLHLYTKLLHPLDRIHVKASLLLSRMGASFARFYMKQGGINKSRAQVQNALCLSTIALLYQARWVQMASQLIHGDLSLKDTSRKVLPQNIPVTASIQDIKNSVDRLDTSNQVQSAGNG